MLFQLVLTKFSKSELFSCLPKVGHVIKSCKEPIRKLSIESSGGLDKVLNFCLDPISINSVLAVFKVSLLEISHLFRLSKL